MAVSAAVMIGLVTVVNYQQRAYYGGHRVRAAQGAGRAALLEIERRLQLAGYGMDASLAFDFDRYVSGPCPSVMPCDRDAIDAPDEIVFFHRNPNYWVPTAYDPPSPEDFTKEPSGNAWRIVSVGLGTVTFAGRAGTSFFPGQILQAVCPGGLNYVYFTVGARLAPLAADNPTASVTLKPSAATDPFLRQDAATDGCFSSGRARMFLIERERLHIRPVTVNGQMIPYLVLDRGLDLDGDGRVTTADETVLAEGIENLQFAYLMTNTALATRGITPGEAISFAPGATGSATTDGITTLVFPGTVQPGQSVYRPTSWYGYTMGPPLAAERANDHQANIRAVRVAIIARSTDRDPDTAALDPTLTTLFNMNVVPSWLRAVSGMSRYEFETTVPIRNSAVRAMNDF